MIELQRYLGISFYSLFKDKELTPIPQLFILSRDLSEGWKGEYKLKDKKNGVYFFVIEGTVTVAGQKLNRRDGLGVSETEVIEIKTDSKTKLLVMEIPMQ